MDRKFTIDGDYDEQEWEPATFREFFDQYDDLVYMNAILESRFPGEQDAMKKRLQRLIKLTDMEACGIRDHRGWVGFPPEIAEFMAILIRRMDSGYMAELSDSRIPKGTIAEEAEKLLAFRRDMLQEIEKFSDPDQKDFCLVILNTLADDAEAEALQEFVGVLRSFEGLLKAANRPLRVKAYRRLSKALSDTSSFMLGYAKRK